MRAVVGVSVMRATSPGTLGSPSYAAPPSVGAALRTGGKPLTPAMRTRWESRLGHDLSRVRVHSDGRAARAADAVNASAFTVGRHVAFGTGFSPASDGGRLLGHELVHTVQQGLADSPDHGLMVRSAGDPQETTARRLASPVPVGVSAPSVQRQERPAGPATTKKVEKPVKIERRVPAAELRKHAAAGPDRPGSAVKAPTGPAGAAPQGSVSPPAAAPQQAPAPAPQQAPAPAPQQPPAQAAQQPPAQAAQQAPAPATPTSAPAGDSGLFKGGRGFGADLQLQPQTTLGARDRFDPSHPDTPRAAPQWRGGLHSGAGDVQLPLNVILLDRELRVAGGETLNVGFEPQLVLTPLGLSPHDGGWHYQPAIAAGLDLLHWKVTEDLDWHIVQAQGFLQGDIPMAGKDGALLGGGFQTGTGVELALPHSGPDEKFTVGANLTGQALWTSDGNFSYAIVGSIFFTWHIRHH